MIVSNKYRSRYGVRNILMLGCFLSAMLAGSMMSLVQATRTVQLQDPSYGEALYPNTFDCQLDAADDSTTKLSKVQLWTYVFYDLPLMTKIRLEWTSDSGTLEHACEQEAISFDSGTSTEYSHTITGEVGQVSIYLTGSDQIEGLKLFETDTSSYAVSEILLGSDSQGNPQTIHLTGPLIGLRLSYQLDIDSLQFYIDSDFCYRSAIHAFNLPDASVQLGYVDQISGVPTAYTFSLVPLNPVSAKHQLGGGIFSTDPCDVAYTVISEANSLFAIDGDSGIIGAKWLTHTAASPTIVGSDVDIYTGWQVDATYTSHPAVDAAYLASDTFGVTIEPACSYSQIAQVDPAATIADMETPFYTWRLQTLPLYTHEYAADWPARGLADPCVISSEVVSGGDTLRKDPNDAGNIEQYTNNYSEYEQVFVVEIKALYSSYPDVTYVDGVSTEKVPPSSVYHVTSGITITNLARCDLYEFKAAQQVPQTAYVVNQGQLRISIDFEYNYDCDLDQYLSAQVSQSGVAIATPSFISFDDAARELIIESTNAADAGYYDISVSSALNMRDPNQIQTSQDTIDFELVISSTDCVNTAFNPATIGDMTYYIDEYQGSDYVNPDFPAFTDTAGTCGGPKYTLTVSDPSIASVVTLSALPVGTRDLTVATNDMTLVGTYQVEILVELELYPSLTPVVGVTNTISIGIDNRCLHTSFDLDNASYWPLLVQQLGEAQYTYSIGAVKDSISMARGNLDGYTYCGERTYTTRLVARRRFVNQLGTELTTDETLSGGSGPLVFYESGLDLRIDAVSQSDIGVYTYELEVGLADYEEYGLDKLGVFPFQVYVMNNCAQSALIMDEPQNVIVQVNQTAAEIVNLPTPIVAISSFRLGLETDPSSPDYEPDLCGSVEVDVKLEDGKDLPEFMVFYESEQTLEIYPTSLDEVGSYEVVLNYNLADYPTHLHQEKFNVLVQPGGVNHPPYLRNVIGFKSKVTLGIEDDALVFPLEIVDPDQGSFEAMTVSITCNPEIDSFSFWNATADNSSFTFKPQATDAGHTYDILVQIHDYELTVDYSWTIFIKMPTVEQTQEIIRQVVAEKVEVKLVAETKNQAQQDFFTMNQLPVTNPRDIELLREMKDYPLPFVDAIDRRGRLTVSFSREIADCETEEQIEAKKAAIEQGLRLELISGDTEEVIGGSKPALPQEAGERRRLDSAADLIEWQITEMDSLGFTMKFAIRQDEALITNENNVMSLIFEEGHNFLVSAEDGKRISKDEFYVTKIIVPRQMPDDDASHAVDALVTILGQGAKLSITIVYALCMLYDLSLTAFWVFFSAVALMAHVALNKIVKHAYTEMSYEMLMSITKMDFFDARDRFNDWLFENFVFTSSGAYNSIFYTMGYTSKNVIANVGPINYIFFFALAASISLQVLCCPKFCLHFDCTRRMALRAKKFQPQTFLIRFFQVYFLVLGISTLIPLTNKSSEDGFTFLDTRKQGGSKDDQMLDTYSWFVLVLLTLMLAVTLLFSLTQARKLHKIAWLNKTAARTSTIAFVLTGEKPVKKKQEAPADAEAIVDGDVKTVNPLEDMVAGYGSEEDYGEEDRSDEKATPADKSVGHDVTNQNQSVSDHYGDVYREDASHLGLIELPDFNWDAERHLTKEEAASVAAASMAVAAPELDDLEANEAADQIQVRTMLAQNLKQTQNAALARHLGKYLRQLQASGKLQQRISENQKLFDRVTLEKKKTRMLWTDIEQYQLFVEFLKGMRTDSIGVATYYSFYVLRRALLVPAIVLLQDHSNMLTHTLLLLGLMAGMLHAAMRHPFSSEGAKRLDWACEAVLYLACSLQIACMSAFNASSADVQDAFDKHTVLEAFGWANVGLLAAFVSLGLGYLLWVTLRQAFRITRQWWRRRRADKQRVKRQKEREAQMEEELAEQRKRKEAKAEKKRIAMLDREQSGIEKRPNSLLDTTKPFVTEMGLIQEVSAVEEDGGEDSAAEKKPSSNILASDSESQQRSEEEGDADSEKSEGEESQPDKEEAASVRSGAKRVKSHAQVMHKSDSEEDKDQIKEEDDSFGTDESLQDENAPKSQAKVKANQRRERMRQALIDLKKLEQVEVNSRNPADTAAKESSTEMPARKLKTDESDHAGYDAMKKPRTMRSNRSKSSSVIKSTKRRPEGKLKRQNRHAFKSQVQTEDYRSKQEQDEEKEEDYGSEINDEQGEQDRKDVEEKLEKSRQRRLKRQDELKKRSQIKKQNRLKRRNSLVSSQSAVSKKSVLSRILSEEPDQTEADKRKNSKILDMETLEHMTDPYRRPSINTNDEILPLPQKHLARQKALIIRQKEEEQEEAQQRNSSDESENYDEAKEAEEEEEKDHSQEME